MNTLYRLANLLSGDYDYKREVVYFSARRYCYNIFMQIITCSVFFSHLIVFAFNNEKVKQEMVYYKIHNGVGERQINLLIGITALSYCPPISVHREFSKTIGDFKMLSFLFCYDEYEMRTRFRLNRRRATNQVRAQILFRRYAWYWLIFFTFNIGLFILKFAGDNPSNKLSFYFALKVVLYCLLFMVEQAALLRSFLILSQFNVSCLYLHNRLKTLIDRIQCVSIKKLSFKSMDRFVTRLLIEYNSIIESQKKLNHHCERNFYLFFCFISFIIVYPIVILFENPNER